MNDRRDEQQELFARIVSGELDPRDESVARALRALPEGERLLAEAERLRGTLERARDERREAVREGLASITPADRELARRFVDRASGTPARRPRHWWRDLGLLAAGLALVLLVRPWRHAPDADHGEPGSGPLSGPTALTAWPVGPVPAIDHFQLPASLPPGGSATILVLRRDEGGELREVLEQRLERTRWELSAEERAALPEELLWTYEIRDALGTVVARGSFEASSSP